MTRCCQVVFQAVVRWESRTRSHAKVEPPRDTDMAVGVQTISRRAIRTVRHLGYLEGASTMLWPREMLRSWTTSPPHRSPPSPKTAWPTVAVRISPKGRLYFLSAVPYHVRYCR